MLPSTVSALSKENVIPFVTMVVATPSGVIAPNVVPPSKLTRYSAPAMPTVPGVVNSITMAYPPVGVPDMATPEEPVKFTKLRSSWGALGVDGTLTMMRGASV